MSRARAAKLGVAVRPADVLVVFGISGDLAKEMTFRALYRLEARGLLSIPVIGVAIETWTDADLRRHLRAAIDRSGERVERKILDRLCARVSYVQGNFSAGSTYERLAAEMRGRKLPVFYLETPPSLFATVVEGLAASGLTADSRLVIEKPFGHDLASARELASRLHRSVREEQIYRVDHFLGKLGVEELLHLRFANAMLAPVWNRAHVARMEITMAERFGVRNRGSFYDPVGALRDVVVNHLLQLLVAATMELPGETRLVDDERYSLLRQVAAADPTRSARGQYNGYRRTPGVARRSTTETYAALELFIDNERWRDVPFYLRAGKRLPTTQTELRVTFRSGTSAQRGVKLAEPRGNELVLRVDPDPGIRIHWEAQRPGSAEPEPITLDMQFSAEGGVGPSAYEILLRAAIAGDRSLFTQQKTVEEEWRIVQPLLDSPPRLGFYTQGSWGPRAAAQLPAPQGWGRLWSAGGA